MTARAKSKPNGGAARGAGGTILYVDCRPEDGIVLRPLTALRD